MYLPEIFKRFVEEHTEIADAYRSVGDLSAKSGPIDAGMQHLIQLGVAIGANSKGAIRSHVRRALQSGATEQEIIQSVLLSGTIVGFPAMIASYGWVREVLDTRGD